MSCVCEDGNKKNCFLFLNVSSALYIVFPLRTCFCLFILALVLHVGDSFESLDLMRCYSFEWKLCFWGQELLPRWLHSGDQVKSQNFSWAIPDCGLYMSNLWGLKGFPVNLQIFFLGGWHLPATILRTSSGSIEPCSLGPSCVGLGSSKSETSAVRDNQHSNLLGVKEDVDNGVVRLCVEMSST